MASEDTPLLVSDAELAHEAVYSRFPPSQKRVIVALVSCSAVLPMFASGSFIPSIPQIAKDLNSTGPIISFAVSLSIFGAALGSLLFATYSNFYGRRPMYLYGLPLLCFGSIGVANARTIPQLMVFRFIQAFGTSGGLALGGGIIADIYKLTERGTAIGIFLCGSAIAPVVGGWGAKYSSWRNVQFGLFFVGLFVFLAMLALLPETSHPGTLGMDKTEECESTTPIAGASSNGPNLLCVTIAATTVLYTDYAILVPIAYTLGARYNITNEAIIGACFLPVGFGNLIGSPVAGDAGGEWVPEDRLRATLFAAATLVPLSMVFCGLITHFVPGPLGLFLNLGCFFLNGLGVDLVLAPTSAYSVDILHSRSSEILAASAGLRSFLLSMAVSGVVPSVSRFGVLITDVGAGIVAWGGFILLWLTIKYGDKMRAWQSVSTQQPWLPKTPPLLASDAELAHEAVYNRFPPSQKRVIVALVSCSAILPMFASGSFIPSIPQIAMDLNSTGPIVSFAVSLSIFGAALGSMLFATYSSFFTDGRRPMYLYGLPLLCFGSIGVATARTIPELMVFRFIQAFGTSGGLAVGGGVIADIYKLTERGAAMGIFFAAALVGNAISPIVGGWGAKYSSWRNVQFGLFFVGLFVFLAMLALLPETSHPGTLGMEKTEDPNLLLVSIAGTTMLYTDYALLIPIAYTLGARYNITNEAIIGACFFPMGLGNLIGSPIAGMLSDRMVIKWRKRRGGEWVPEDRLRATLFAAAILVPLSIVLCGVITHFVPGPLGLFLNLICFFLNGLGVDLVLAPSSAYSVDIMHSRSSEMLAASSGLRSFLISVALSGVVPSVSRFGVLITDVGAGIVAWSGFILLWITIKYGDKMRAWVDVGYSTIETT
ncbi:MFS general substrate transporter [Mycena sanguinolenta]|uniref:MFS general substrate transporter n=1 Tax=Mycena sanguinolenta TaxID=230812 RepID=A0A8H7DLR9_9AGAR|nr:MFS general substrate transporter [Mycena sanguinolenta]